MRAGWKGGIGNSSRRLPARYGGHLVGVLVQTNFGGLLTVDGVPVGRELEHIPLADQPRRRLLHDHCGH